MWQLNSKFLLVCRLVLSELGLIHSYQASIFSDYLFEIAADEIMGFFYSS